MCGSLNYQPPEMITQTAYGRSVDIWGVGILTFELLTGKPPFASSDQNLTFKKITECQIDYPDYVSE